MEGEIIKQDEVQTNEAVAYEFVSRQVDEDEVDATSAAMPLFSSFFGVPRFKVHVTTGDKANAGTDSTVLLRLVDSVGAKTEWTRLDKFFTNDHERGETHTYTLPAQQLERPDDIAFVQVRRKSTLIDDHWFLDRIELEDTTEKFSYVYPVQRWIKKGVDYSLYQYDAFLPFQDPKEELRKTELEEKRQLYQFKETIPNGPRQVKDLPSDEEFSSDAKADIVIEKGKLLIRKLFLEFTTQKWKSFNDIQNIYFPNQSLPKPACIEYWKDDKWFGLQRVQGVDPVLITLCKSIPEKLAVSPDMVEPFLESLSLQDALDNNKIFMIDLEILDGITCKVDKLVSPIALFYLDKSDELLPIAIQLFQEPSDKNPVYLPSDPANCWLLAKMFYNMAEAQHHQAFTHLGMTHLLMESISVAAHRNLSPSHPIFRLLAPHFLYLLAINARGLEKLISKGGWIDLGMTVGRDGMFELIAKGFQNWNLQQYGDVENEIRLRGVLDPEILPYYPYRDDGLPLFEIIKKYVTNIVNYYYDSDEKLERDYEVQNWCKEMATPLSEDGLGIGGMPDKFESADQLAAVCTAVITACSMGHAGSFQQYETYGFVPNYPGILLKPPPESKMDLDDDDLLEYLPDKETTLYIMVITSLLSRKGTQSLGDFEVQYLHEPPAVHIADEFRLELSKLSLQMKQRNRERKFKHEWLDPDIVPNSISI
ncbi:polyunsaturated fatty acid 5-lipoxygenase-like [Neocloeon triangulifer]|uniref:polyunsaturated fatty acid 5-lipoxygenase-like n=1 Tax=Neocloeon triangulifer TaxID=2078957 RepID=UPI00286EFF82|nr:polyunsaturated fatty acid 5-lipoxygenase-like [Neocloeon triangulifer]